MTELSPEYIFIRQEPDGLPRVLAFMMEDMHNSLPILWFLPEGKLPQNIDPHVIIQKSQQVQTMF
ncbi:hypothetical protein DPMN_112910 [Dreissena polymorpha]|uniref:Uncharacterized protein n=1 Tax=Dreissena polymorpha TaxID=45954 RepID=A0A9D4KHE5_DREPO|nr:hypothetical protein DPMN_112910 [Dreissena polymorpha]